MCITQNGENEARPIEWILLVREAKTHTQSHFNGIENVHEIQ